MLIPITLLLSIYYIFLIFVKPFKKKLVNGLIMLIEFIVFTIYFICAFMATKVQYSSLKFDEFHNYGILISFLVLFLNFTIILIIVSFFVEYFSLKLFNLQRLFLVQFKSKNV